MKDMISFVMFMYWLAGGNVAFNFFFFFFNVQTIVVSVTHNVSALYWCLSDAVLMKSGRWQTCRYA